MKDVERLVKTQTHAKQFVHVATRHNLLVRFARGRYVALDPSIAFRVPALPTYWARLLAIHDTLQMLSIPHAFACLTTREHTDLIPGQPWPVVRLADHGSVTDLDAFGFSYGATRDFEVDVMGLQLTLPAANLEDTALLLASTSLPREIAACKQILGKIAVRPSLAKKLNSYGINWTAQTTKAVRPAIQLPRPVLQRRRVLADAMLRGSVG